jgi:hypothetical protein
MHGSAARLFDRQVGARAWRRAAWSLGSIALLLSVLTLTSCSGSGATTPASLPTPSPHMTLSQSDSATLAFMADTATLIDADAAAAADYLTSLETGKWLKLKAQEQLAVLSKLESLSQALSRKITEGYPKAQAADLKAAEKGPFDVASRACSDYISEAADAASNLLYLPAAQVRADTPHWVERIVEKADLYAPARKRLREVVVALQAKYGG